MRLERVQPTSWRVTLHPLELAALISAARWAVDGAGGELPPEAVQQLRGVLASYDTAITHS
jgi:hypothetical protein